MMFTCFFSLNMHFLCHLCIFNRQITRSKFCITICFVLAVSYMYIYVSISTCIYTFTLCGLALYTVLCTCTFCFLESYLSPWKQKVLPSPRLSGSSGFQGVVQGYPVKCGSLPDNARQFIKCCWDSRKPRGVHVCYRSAIMGLGLLIDHGLFCPDCVRLGDLEACVAWECMDAVAALCEFDSFDSVWGKRSIRISARNETDQLHSAHWIMASHSRIDMNPSSLSLSMLGGVTVSLKQSFVCWTVQYTGYPVCAGRESWLYWQLSLYRHCVCALVYVVGVGSWGRGICPGFLSTRTARHNVKRCTVASLPLAWPLDVSSLSSPGDNPQPGPKGLKPAIPTWLSQ